MVVGIQLLSKMPVLSKLFVRPLEDPLICPICIEGLEDPLHAVSICDHCFCSSCIREYLNKKGNCIQCPVCNRGPITPEKLQTSRLLVAILEKLEVRCDGEGCDEVMTFEVYKRHRRVCATESVICQNAECQVSLLRRERASHRCVSLWKKRAGAAEVKCKQKDRDNNNLKGVIAALELRLSERDREVENLKAIVKTTDIWKNRALVLEKQSKELEENVQTCINVLTANQKRCVGTTPEDPLNASSSVASSSGSEVACASTSNEDCGGRVIEQRLNWNLSDVIHGRWHWQKRKVTVENQRWELTLRWNSDNSLVTCCVIRPKESNTAVAHSLVISIFDKKSQQIYKESGFYSGSGPVTYAYACHKLPNSIVEKPNNKTVKTTLKVLLDVDPINIEHLQEGLFPPLFLLCRSVTVEKKLSWNMEEVLTRHYSSETFSIAQDDWRVSACKSPVSLSTRVENRSARKSTCLKQVIIDVLDEQFQALYHQTSVWSGKITYSHLDHCLPNDAKQNLSGKKLEITVIYVVHF